MLPQRRGNDPLTRHINLLRRVVRPVRAHHPLHIHGGMAWSLGYDGRHAAQCAALIAPYGADNEKSAGDVIREK